MRVGAPDATFSSVLTHADPSTHAHTHAYTHTHTQTHTHTHSHTHSHTGSTFLAVGLESKIEGKVKWIKSKCTTTLGEVELVLVPVHVKKNHWCLLVADIDEGHVYWYDSFHSKPGTLAAAVVRWLMNVAQRNASELAKHGRTPQQFDFTQQQIQMGSGPTQYNGCDCGIFTMKTADRWSLGLPPHFVAKNCPVFRQRICLDLLRGYVLDYVDIFGRASADAPVSPSLRPGTQRISRQLWQERMNASTVPVVVEGGPRYALTSTKPVSGACTTAPAFGPPEDRGWAYDSGTSSVHAPHGPDRNDIAVTMPSNYRNQVQQRTEHARCTFKWASDKWSSARGAPGRSRQGVHLRQSG